MTLSLLKHIGKTVKLAKNICPNVIIIHSHLTTTLQGPDIFSLAISRYNIITDAGTSSHVIPSIVRWMNGLYYTSLITYSILGYTRETAMFLPSGFSQNSLSFFPTCYSKVFVEKHTLEFRPDSFIKVLLFLQFFPPLSLSNNKKIHLLNFKAFWSV